MSIGHPKRTPPPRMLTEGNTHLGKAIWTFSLPARSTCPGATPACLLACYALRFRFFVGPAPALHKRNWERSLEPQTFARDMIREIRRQGVAILRVHVAGDFYSVPYIHAWCRIARACHRVTFLFYTRSWTVPELVDPLVELASLDNVFAWWSEDRDTGPCLLPSGRRAFLCVTEADEALVPHDVDLVFRDKTRTPRKWVGPVWVCPKEQNVPHDLTCSSCRRCFEPGPMPRRHLA